MYLSNSWLAHRFWHIALIIGLSSTGFLRAETEGVESLKAQVNQKIRQQQSSQALQLLIDQESRFAGEIDFDYLLGVLALENGELSIAEIALERVVLINPSHAGAWLDLAVAKFRQGDVAASRQIIQHIEQNFNPSADLAQELNAVKARFQDAERKQSGWHGMLSLSYGYDSNANYGLSTDAIALTPLAGAPVLIQIDPSHKQQGDSAGQLRAQAVKTFLFENGSESHFLVQTQVKKLSEQTNFDQYDLNMVWQHIYPLSRNKNWYLALTPTARYISLGGQSFGEVFTGSAGVFNKLSGCDIGLSLDFEKRLYERSVFASATIPWVAGIAACQSNGYSYGVSGRYGMDYPDSKRAGGRTEKKELNLFVRKPIGTDWLLGMQLYVANYSDHQAYSVLIDNGAVRDLIRLSQKLEINYRLPSFKQWWLRAEFEHLNDSSNLSMGNLEDLQGYLGVRYIF